MKVRKFKYSETPFLMVKPTEINIWINAANHGYAEACKDHQELVGALEIAIQNWGSNTFWLEDCKKVLAKYKGE